MAKRRISYPVIAPIWMIQTHSRLFEKGRESHITKEKLGSIWEIAGFSPITGYDVEGLDGDYLL